MTLGILKHDEKGDTCKKCENLSKFWQYYLILKLNHTTGWTMTIPLYLILSAPKFWQSFNVLKYFIGGARERDLQMLMSEAGEKSYFKLVIIKQDQCQMRNNEDRLKKGRDVLR